MDGNVPATKPTIVDLIVSVTARWMRAAQRAVPTSQIRNMCMFDDGDDGKLKERIYMISLGMSFNVHLLVIRFVCRGWRDQKIEDK